MAKSHLAKAICLFTWGDRYKLMVDGPEYILLKGPDPNPALLTLLLVIAAIPLAIWGRSLVLLTVLVAQYFQLFSRETWEWDEIGTYWSHLEAIEAKDQLIKKYYTLRN